MGCHLIALGGTGQKTLEMLTYACACDALYTLDDDLRRVPLDTLSALTADTDLAAAADAVLRYQALQTVFSAASLPHAGFHTRLLHESLPVVSEARPDVHSIAGERDQLLLRSIFTPEKSTLDARGGLRGQADLGMFFFADALCRLSERLAQGGESPFLDRIREELDRGEEAKVLLVGSIYGGTGMSGIPSMARFLRGRFPSERLILGAALLLPPHDPRTADDYNARAEATLRQYGVSALMRHSVYDTDGLLDAAYLVRTTGNLYAENYAQAAASTQNDLRLHDWLAARCASQFYSTAFRGENAANLGLYHVPRTSHQPSWPCFDDDRAYFRLRFGGLMRAAALHLAELEPQIASSLSGKARPAQMVTFFFKAAKGFDTDGREALDTLLAAFKRFLSQFVRRMGEVQRVKPTPIQGKAGAESFFEPRALTDLQQLMALPETEVNGAEALRRSVRDSLPALVTGGADNSFTVKRALAQLLKARKPAVDTPAAAFAAYAAALLDCTAQGAGGLPALQLPPPDSRGIDPNHNLLTLARNLPLSEDAPFCDGPDVLAWETRLAGLLSLPYAQSVHRPEVVAWRGLIAVLLLWDGWEIRHTLPTLRCAPPPEGEGTRAVLAALPKDRLNAGLTLFTLGKDVDEMLFEGTLGMLSNHTALLSAADPQKLYGLLPDCVRWYDREQNAFLDPCPLLNEADRTRLVHRLKCLQALTERAELRSPLLKGGGAIYAAAEAFLGDLQNRHDFWRERFEQGDQKAVHALYIRALAVFGPAVEGLEREEEELSLHDLKQNPLMKRLLGEPGEPKRGPSPSALFQSEPITSYYYRGAPFAVASQRYLLTPANVEGEQEALNQLEAVIEGMASPAYHRQAAMRFLELANRLTSRSGASKKAVSLLRAWSVKHSRMAQEAAGAGEPAEQAGQHAYGMI